MILPSHSELYLVGIVTMPLWIVVLNSMAWIDYLGVGCLERSIFELANLM